MLGWSNDQSLDEPFKLDHVARGLDQLYHRLSRRRPTVLAQTAKRFQDGFAADKRQLDGVDRLYGLPGELYAKNRRLLRYLNVAFAGGEWSQPLFLRGIYFTTALRENDALDQTLIEILGVPPEQLDPGGNKVIERSYFIRDVFVDKVFQEKGLVAGGGRRCATFAGAIAWRCSDELGRGGAGRHLFLARHQSPRRRGRQPKRLLARHAQELDTEEPDIEVVKGARYVADEDLVQLHGQAPDYLETTVTAPGIFKIASLVRGDNMGDSDDAAAARRRVSGVLPQERRDAADATSRPLARQRDRTVE